MTRYRLWLVVTCVVSLACASGPRHPFEIEPGYENAPGVERVFLVPMNAFGDMSEEFHDGARRTFEETQGYLERQSMDVATLPLFEVREAARVETQESDGPGDAKIRAFIENLRKQHDFELLVLPSIVLRAAKLRGVSAIWDGVRRPMMSGHTWSGQWQVLSLSVAVYDARGVRVFYGLGGLDHVQRLEGRLGPVVRIADPLANREHLREGVAIAFHPLLPIVE